MNPIELAASKGLFLAVAESLTAGSVMARLAGQPGASSAFLGGVVAYQDAIKTNLLGVDELVVAEQTAVCSQVAEQMALAVQNDFALSCDLAITQVIGLATTGVAGPDPVRGKPVGMVYLAVCSEFGVRHRELHLAGSRDEIRDATTSAAIAMLVEEIQRF